MDFVIGEGRGHASALLSKYPIQQSINHAGLRPYFSHSFLQATVLDPCGDEWPVSVVHLPAGATDADESARMYQIGIILDELKEHRSANRPHLICGDFNSNAPYQNIDPARCKKQTQQAWRTNGSGLPRNVIQTVIDAGYSDTYSVLHDERTGMTGSFDTQTPGQRVDYIFAFGVPGSNVRGAWIEQDRLAKYASDHFPIGVDVI